MLATEVDLGPFMLVLIFVGLAAGLVSAAGLVCLVIGLLKKHKVLTAVGLSMFGLGMLITMGVAFAMFMG
jgi:hypothetical protein